MRSLNDLLEARLDEMDAFMQHCVPKVVAKGKDKSAAFAICTATGKKAGYYQGKSRKLTKKGKTSVKSKQQDPEHKNKVGEYEYAIDRVKPKTEAVDEKLINRARMMLGMGVKPKAAMTKLVKAGVRKQDAYLAIKAASQLDEAFNRELKDLMFRAQSAGGKQGKTLMMLVNSIARGKWNDARAYFKRVSPNHKATFSRTLVARLTEGEEGQNREQLDEFLSMFRKKSAAPKSREEYAAWKQKKMHQAGSQGAVAAGPRDAADQANMRSCTQKGGKWQGGKCKWANADGSCGAGEKMVFGRCAKVRGMAAKEEAIEKLKRLFGEGPDAGPMSVPLEKSSVEVCPITGKPRKPKMDGTGPGKKRRGRAPMGPQEEVDRKRLEDLALENLDLLERDGLF